MAENKILKNNQYIDCLGLFDNDKYMYRWTEFKMFNYLCDKAKELIFIYGYKSMKFYDILDKYYLNVPIVGELTPIEQIMYISFIIYNDCNTNKNLYLDIKLQSFIDCDDHYYIADFLIDYAYINGKKIELIKPLIIECDGYEYHSNKHQMEYDYTRENDLKVNGYDIIRFTGSQIYNKPIYCAKCVYDYIYKNINNKEK